MTAFAAPPNATEALGSLGTARSGAGGTPGGATIVAAYRRTAARASGCAARAPSLAALGLAWRLRADALALAAAYVDSYALDNTTADAAARGRAGHLRQLARAWAAGATRLVHGDAQGPRWRAWLDDYLARSSALPGEGAAWAAMRAEFVVWCLAAVVNAVRPAEARGEARGAPPTTTEVSAIRPTPSPAPAPGHSARAGGTVKAARRPRAPDATS